MCEKLKERVRGSEAGEKSSFRPRLVLWLSGRENIRKEDCILTFSLMRKVGELSDVILIQR